MSAARIVQVAEPGALVVPSEAYYVEETATGLVFADDTPLDVVGPLIERLARQHKRIEWALGDAMNFAESRYGDTYTAWVEQTGLAENTLATIRWVAEKIESSRRREDVGWSHHREVAPLPAPMQDRLLERAAEKGMTRWEVRQAVKVEEEKLRGRAVTAEGDAVETAELPWHATEDDLAEDARRSMNAWAPKGRFRTAWVAGYLRALVWAGQEDCFIAGRWRG